VNDETLQINFDDSFILEQNQNIIHKIEKQKKRDEFII